MIEKIMFGLKVAVLGLGTTFLALFGLILVINLINRVLNYREEDKKKPGLSEEENIKVSVEADGDQKDDEGIVYDEELVAVISAAIAASLNRSSQDIVVRKVRRVPYHAPAWNIASRREQISTRL